MTEEEFVGKFRGGRGARVAVDADGRERREELDAGEREWFAKLIYRLFTQPGTEN